MLGIEIRERTVQVHTLEPVGDPARIETVLELARALVMQPTLDLPGGIERTRIPDMLHVEVTQETTAPPDAVLDTLRERSPERRHTFWSNVKPGRFQLHDAGPDFLEVTEATIIVGVFWERSRYEWPDPGRVTATVLESNVFRPGSTFDLRAAAAENGHTRVRLTVRREFQGGVKGRIASTLNHLGGRRLFGWYLGSAMKAVERDVRPNRS